MNLDKKLYKSSTNKMLAGVCGGIAEYFGVDPTWIRLAWVIFSMTGGAGVLAYIVAALIIPDEPA
ncbi:MAG: PspC domain-containing protein [Lachnospiraceae bacterium]|jgi:phage shock protein C|nr:PspC domain-containing protein [Lachnospiraceae bacterium]MBQ6312462.1 PspC domain-containing protein [Lachnospiraceae bacterium]MBQ6353814.1 PspC domain-containing protein [Lachnospiraceae bacterium]MBR2752744.1 PspC domain-containing protein [Lachnospiraceae bacterium]